MDKEDFIGRSIHYLCLYGPTVVMAWSLVIMTRDPYGYIRFGGRGIIHSISALSLATTFLFIYSRLRYLYPLVRAIITACFTVLSIQLYDFTWSFCKYLQLGYDFRLTPLLAVAIAGALLWFFNIKHNYLTLSKEPIVKSLFYAIIFVLAFGIMMMSGFYERMELYDNGLGPDPNVGCTSWAIGKVVVFWILTPLIRKSQHRSPLRLDPRVLVW